ncbi:MAG: hypothetical protein HYZ28_28655 [Myxococcales bacterium]|nr:hypothetical protein [Myxococcales bacterium]
MTRMPKSPRMSLKVTQLNARALRELNEADLMRVIGGGGGGSGACAPIINSDCSDGKCK